MKTRMHHNWVVAFMMAAVLLLIAGMQPLLSQEQPSIPRLTQYATDLTGTLTWEQLSRLNAKLKEFDDSTSTQIVVLMMPTTGSSPLEEFTLKVGEVNKVGKKGKDNGALLFVAKNDRKIRIEVGYGLEGPLPDALAGQIIRREIGPRFVEGDFYGGIDAGVDAILKATRNEYTADPSEKVQSLRGLIPFLIILLIFFMIFSRAFRRSTLGSSRRSGGWGGFPPIGGGWGGGGSGGGFGGGGGGGFSGGGGSFGGGGASGSW